MLMRNPVQIVWAPFAKFETAFLAAVAANVAFATSLMCAAPASAGSGWTLRQDEDDFEIQPTAVKVVNKRFGFELISKAPDWNVTCYRKDAKVMWQAPLNRFNNLMLYRPLVDASRTNPILAKRVGPVIYRGHKCIAYQTGSSMLYGSTEIKAAPQAAEFVCRYLYTPTIREVPVFYVKPHPAVEINRRERGWFETNRYDLPHGRSVITESIVAKNFADDEFSVPRGFRRVADIKEVSVSKGTRKQFESMLKDVGFMSDDK